MTDPRPGADAPRPDLGVIGGSGFYSFLSDADRVAVDTPFGPPSADVAVGEVAGRTVAFLPRHGERHQYPPHQVNYRANLWALRAVGVRQVLAPCAVGSLQPALTPGTIVVPDQVVDRTWGRAHTVYEIGGAAGPGSADRGLDQVVHVAFADPYCPRGRRVLVDSAAGDAVDGGTLVVVNGPRFSTRAESVWHAAQGWSLVGMTGLPEASIARELALCYSCVALVTDHDAGVEGEVGDGAPVTHQAVLAQFAANIDRLKDLLRRTIEAMPQPEDDATATCECRRALDGLTLPVTLPDTLP